MGSRGTAVQHAPERQNGRRDLQRNEKPETAWPGGSFVDHREYEGDSPHGILRSNDHPPRLPFGRERVSPEQSALPFKGHPRFVYGHRDGERRVFGDRTENGGIHSER